MSICILPWIEFGIGQQISSLCCYLQTNYFKPFTEVWDGLDHWNSNEVVEIRKRMLETGKEGTCCKTRCPFYAKDYKIDNNLCWSCKKSTELDNTVARAFKAIENKETVLDYEPLFLRFGSTYKCNCLCPMCFVGTNKDLEQFSPKLQQFDNLKRYVENCFTYIISGGEFFALSDEEINSNLKYVNKDRTMTTVYSNGQLLTLEKYKRLVDESSIDRITISIDSVDPAMYKIMRGRDFNNIQKNFSDIFSAFPINKIKSFNCVITRVTYSGILDLIKFANSFGIKSVSFTPLDAYNVRGKTYGFLDIYGKSYSEFVANEFKEIIVKSESYAKEKGIYIFGLWECVEFMNRSREF